MKPAWILLTALIAIPFTVDAQNGYDGYINSRHRHNRLKDDAFLLRTKPTFLETGFINHNTSKYTTPRSISTYGQIREQDFVFYYALKRAESDIGAKKIQLLQYAYEQGGDGNVLWYRNHSATQEELQSFLKRCVSDMKKQRFAIRVSPYNNHTATDAKLIWNPDKGGRLFVRDIATTEYSDANTMTITRDDIAAPYVTEALRTLHTADNDVYCVAKLIELKRQTDNFELLKADVDTAANPRFTLHYLRKEFDEAALQKFMLAFASLWPNDKPLVLYLVPDVTSTQQDNALLWDPATGKGTVRIKGVPVISLESKHVGKIPAFAIQSYLTDIANK